MTFVLDNVGLCKNCDHHREIKNDRGSSFHLCRLSESDARFPKYPRLPMLRCDGYIPRADAAEPAPNFQPD